jgi:hypothetical protein
MRSSTPTPSITNTQATKPYVGTAKTVPDSLTPRRFISATRTTNPSANPTVCGASCGTADTMFATPAATDTATVST